MPSGAAALSSLFCPQHWLMLSTFILQPRKGISGVHLPGSFPALGPSACRQVLRTSLKINSFWWVLQPSPARCGAQFSCVAQHSLYPNLSHTNSDNCYNFVIAHACTQFLCFPLGAGVPQRQSCKFTTESASRIWFSYVLLDVEAQCDMGHP